MAKLFANSGDPDQMPRSACLIWVCTVCQVAFYGYPDYNGLKTWPSDNNICHTVDFNPQSTRHNSRRQHFKIFFLLFYGLTFHVNYFLKKKKRNSNKKL